MEEKIGIVTDYLDRIGVAVIRLADGDLRRGDQVRIAGRTTDVTQAAESLQIEHRPVEQALRGSEVASKYRGLGGGAARWVALRARRK